MNYTVATIGSHSALDICRGAKDEGFETLVVAQKGREKTYAKYYKTHANLGCIDEVVVLNKFSDILYKEIQEKLKKRNSIFIPNRSLEAYLDFDYSSIEKKFNIPIFGNKFLLKVLESIRGFERAFFLIDSYKDYQNQVEQRLKNKVFTSVQLKNAVIEEFITGVQVNFNFFYSPIDKRLELLGTDTRRQTNLDGILRIPVDHQLKIIEKLDVKYEEAGHIAVTVLESMLEQIFEIGERFVKTSQKLYPPGVIGPFALQAAILPGPPKKEIVVFDVSPRMPGSPGISATPYSGYLYGEPISVGKRIAMEIKRAIEIDRLKEIIT